MRRLVVVPWLFCIGTSFSTLRAAAEPVPPVSQTDADPRRPADIKAPGPLDATVPQDRPPFVEPEEERRGFFMSLPFSIAVPSGSYADGVEASSFGVGTGFGVLLGVYVTEHLGFAGGFSGSANHQGVSGCRANDRCGGTRHQFPILVQYALVNRKQGLYFQAGLGFASTYQVVVEDAGAFKVSSPFDAKLGVGYRLTPDALGVLRDKPSRLSMDWFANLDVGQFDHTSGAIVREGRRFDGEIAAPATHVLAELGVALHWTP